VCSQIKPKSSTSAKQSRQHSFPLRRAMASVPLSKGKRGRPTGKRRHEDSLCEVLGDSVSLGRKQQHTPLLSSQPTNSFGDFSLDEYDAELSMLQQDPGNIPPKRKVYEASAHIFVFCTLPNLWYLQQL
jgi:hypothetical protein